MKKINIKVTNTKVIILMVFLAIFIILPPFFRLVFPKEKEQSLLSNSDKLTCSLKKKDSYSVEFQTTYKDKKVEKIVITFTDEGKDGQLVYSDNQDQTNYFCALSGSHYHYVDSSLIVTLTQEAFNLNKEDKTIKSMFQDILGAKKYYTKMGYTCSE